MLEWELSNHPDKAFVRQLIDDLQHGCNIGYLGPQFAHSANNLASASRQPEVIDTALQKSVKRVEFSAHSSHLLCKTFVHQAWVLSQNTMEIGESYTTFRHLHRTVSMIT